MYVANRNGRLSKNENRQETGSEKEFDGLKNSVKKS